MGFSPISSLASPAIEPVNLSPIDKAQAREHNEAARAHFEKGDFEKAVAEYEKAYAIIQSAKLQYNIGTCYANLGNYEAAVRAWRIYMEGTVGDPVEKERREEVRMAIENYEKDQVSFRAKEGQAKDEYVPPADSSAPPAGPEVISEPETVSQTPPKKSLKPWIIGAAVLGAVGALGSVVALALAKRKESEYAGTVNEGVKANRIICRRGDCDYADEAAKEEYEGKLGGIENSMNLRGTLSKIGAAVGGAALVTGGVLFAIDRKAVRVEADVKMGEVGVKAFLRW